MSSSYLLKTEPAEYSFADLQARRSRLNGKIHFNRIDQRHQPF
jgi:hypothetical protein